MEPHYFVAITLPNHIKEVLSNYRGNAGGITIPFVGT